MIGEKRISDEESMDLIEMFTKILFQDVHLGWDRSDLEMLFLRRLLKG